MKLSGIPFYPAHSSNYSKGRGGRSIKYFTVHHTAGFEATLRYLWGNPNRNASSHFFAGDTHSEQYVDTADTAWCNGNFLSNQESISCETRGDWRNGYKDGTTLSQLEMIMYRCLKVYPNLRLTYHMDVSDKSTACPADLKHKGYALQCWNRAKARIAAENAPKPTPKPTPAPAKITYRKITPKRIELLRNASLWDFNFTDWAKAKSKGDYPKGHMVDVVAIAKNALGGEYYMTAYSYNNGSVRATNGFNVKDAKDYVAPKPTPTPTPTPVPAPTPPPVKPVWVAMDNPRKMRTTVDLKVTDLDTLKEVGETIAKGTPIDLVDKKTMPDKRVYVRSKWAKTNNKNWGVRLDYMEEIPSAPEVPPETIPPTPIDTDPSTPSDSDVIEAKGIIEAIKALLDKLLAIILRRKK